MIVLILAAFFVIGAIAGRIAVRYLKREAEKKRDEARKANSPK